MRRFLCLALLLSLPAMSHAQTAPRTWTTAHTVLAVGASLAWVADCSTTVYGVTHGYEENNLLLGRHPSAMRVRLTCAGQIGATLIVAKVLPDPWRTFWLVAAIGVEAFAAYGNVTLGARLTL